MTDERQSFHISRAQPIAGPGIDPENPPRRQRRATERNGATPTAEQADSGPNATRTAIPANSVPLDDVLTLIALPPEDIHKALGALKCFQAMNPSSAQFTLALMARLWPGLFAP